MILLLVNNYLKDCNTMHRNDYDTKLLISRLNLYRKNIRKIFWDALDFKVPVTIPVQRPLRMFNLLNKPTEVITLD